MPNKQRSAPASSSEPRRAPAARKNTAPTKGMQARERIIGVAETLFNQAGFDRASMRDIAAAANMQPASMYYHFKSKEELLWAVWEKGGVELLNRVSDAIRGVSDTWQRLETACVAHVSGLLDWRRANQALFIMPPWHYPDGIKDRVIALRDRYEKMFVRLIEDLPLRGGIDRRYLRLILFGALSWTLFWFKKGKDDPPEVIAREMLKMLRSGINRP